MAIDELTTLVPVPDGPVGASSPEDWTGVEERLGIRLPSDYRDFVHVYGSGELANFIVVYTPFAKDPYAELCSQVQMTCNIYRELKEIEGEQEIPYPIFPEPSGLLPWGNDTNGNNLNWLTEGDADNWPIIISAGRDKRWQRFDLPMTTFLAKALRGDVVCTIWPEDFPGATNAKHRIFTPFPQSKST